jgi:hypothetical protein
VLEVAAAASSQRGLERRRPLPVGSGESPNLIWASGSDGEAPFGDVYRSASWVTRVPRINNPIRSVVSGTRAS